MAVKVAINGYGTVGRRVADAVAAQDDMKIIGVVKTKPTFEAHGAVEKGFPLYVNVKENMQAFKDAGLKVEGTVKELLEEADIVVDGSPDGIGIENKKSSLISQRRENLGQTVIKFQ